MGVWTNVASTLNTKTLRRLGRNRRGPLGFLLSGALRGIYGARGRELEARGGSPLLGQLRSSLSFWEGERMTSSVASTRRATTTALVSVLTALTLIVVTVRSTGRRSGRGSCVVDPRHGGLVTTVGWLVRGVHTELSLHLGELEGVARHTGLTLDGRRVPVHLLLRQHSEVDILLSDLLLLLLQKLNLLLQSQLLDWYR